MTLYEALQDVGRGRIVDDGCSYELIALAKGTYIFEHWSAPVFTVTLDGKRGENARTLKRMYYKFQCEHKLATWDGGIIRAEYRR